MLQRLCLSLLVLCSVVIDAKLRGTNYNPVFTELKEELVNAKLPRDLMGKSLADLGLVVDNNNNKEMEQQQQQQQDRSLTQFFSGRIIRFFSISEEFGPPVSHLGQTSGINGFIYDQTKYAQGKLTDEDIFGTLKASCSAVASNLGQFCTFELLIGEPDGETFGSVIASGAVEFREGQGGILIVEAAGDSFRGFSGGLFSLTYDLIGSKIVLSGELSLSL